MMKDKYRRPTLEEAFREIKAKHDRYVEKQDDLMLNGEDAIPDLDQEVTSLAKQIKVMRNKHIGGMNKGQRLADLQDRIEHWNGRIDKLLQVGLTDKILRRRTMMETRISQLQTMIENITFGRGELSGCPGVACYTGVDVKGAPARFRNSTY